MLYLAWKHGGENPYCLYNGLTPDFRPLEDPLGEPIPPRFPSRLKLFIYGLGLFANDAESNKKKRPKPRQG